MTTNDNIDKNQSIRGYNNEARYNNNYSHRNRTYELTDMAATTGKLKEGEGITHVMVDNF